MTQPHCPGCLERDARIAELERQVSELATAHRPVRKESDPPDTAAASDSPTVPKRNRTRLPVDPARRRRRHRLKNALKKLAYYGLWVLLFAVSALFIWEIVSLLAPGGPSPMQ